MSTALERYALLEAEGDYYDGMTAEPRSVIVRFGESSLTLMTPDDMPVAHWALATLRSVENAGADILRLAPARDSDERLTIRDPDMIAAIRIVCADLDRRPREPSALPRIALWSAGAVAAVLLILFVLIPAIAGRLALLIPPAQEAKLGEAVVEQIVWVLGKAGGGEAPRFCVADDGVGALEEMTARLTRGIDLDTPLKVRVLAHPMANAFAAPGGHVLLFEGLIDDARSPEEVAGVLAHEIGHVAARDPTRNALRTAGSAGILGLVLGDFAGGALVLAMTEAVMQASYQRDAEAAADAFALRALTAGGLPTGPFADFFERMAERHGGSGGLVSHLATHPDIAERAAAARDADSVGQAPFQPVLSDNDWIALRQICAE